MRILLVDDDELLTQILIPHLTSQHYVVDTARDGQTGLAYAQAATYDLIVLDINLPKLDGIRLCQTLRQTGYVNPILLLTAKGASSDKVVGLDAGADDYVVKPCTIEELGARIRALLRRQSSMNTSVLQWGELRLDPRSREASYQDKGLSLSPKEYSLLELFLRHPQRIFNSSLILEHLWSFEDAPNEETVRSHIKRLRQKLKAVGADEVIENIYGMGYRLKAIVEPVAATSDTQPAVAERARNAAIAAWDRMKTPILERLTVLEQAATAARLGVIPEELRMPAEHAAHKLAGSLGMFGFPEGSRIGQDLEEWLRGMTETSDRPTMIALVDRLQVLLQQPPATEEADFLSSFVEDSPTDHSAETTRLLVVEADSELVQQWETEAVLWGIQLEVATDILQARARLVAPLPNALLLDLSLVDVAVSDGSLLDELSDEFPDLPVLVLADRDDFGDRLDVARRQGYRFLMRSQSPAQVLEAVYNVVQQQNTAEVRVLAIDDDPLVLTTLKRCLSRWGIQVIGVDDPRRFWDTLKRTIPDIVIFDVEMPQVSGIDLCRVVRNDSTWNGLPILFLTARKDLETIQAIYRAGADDYVAKPFSEPEIVTRIFNRLERTRLLQNLTTPNPLTGIANRHQSTLELNRYLGLSRRFHLPLCLAVLNLEPRDPADALSALETQQLISRQFAHQLRQMFRMEDVVAQWRNDEFLVGIYGLSKQRAVERLEQVLHTIRQEIAKAEPTLPALTFSAGLAESPDDGIDLSTLYRAATLALRQAKRISGDRIELANPHP